jgi:hypothetical protein
MNNQIKPKTKRNYAQTGKGLPPPKPSKGKSFICVVLKRLVFLAVFFLLVITSSTTKQTKNCYHKASQGLQIRVVLPLPLVSSKSLKMV